MATNWMSQAQYAKHRKVERSTVHQWIREGKLNGCIKIGSNQRKLIDQERADKYLSGEMETEKVDHKKSSMGSHLTSARTAKTAVEAKIAQLKHERLAGRLVSKEVVIRAANEMATITRESLLTIPDRLAAQLSAETDQNKIRLILRDEISNALSNLSKTNYNFFTSDDHGDMRDDEPDQE